MGIEQKPVPAQLKQQPDTLSFSVILCTYNRRNLVLSTLASLRRQTLPYTQFEVIVVDNGSIDGTLAVVQEYVNALPTQGRQVADTWRVSCLSEPRNGLAYARNTGLLLASGAIAVFLDDDTTADSHFLEHLLTAYGETGADAIGGRVELRLEAPQPHWLNDSVFEALGRFAPSSTRVPLPPPLAFSSSNFSVRVETLRAIGYFSPLLNKRQDAPLTMGVDDLCLRLRKAGYTLWYEPEALVSHRVAAARLQRPYFLGRAYWQGRSEVLAQYINRQVEQDNNAYTFWPLLHSIRRAYTEVARIALLHRPLQRFAGASSSERLLLAMEQARHWGQAQQLSRILEHIPVEHQEPSVLLVHPNQQDGTTTLLTSTLLVQDVRLTTSACSIPLSWLWQQRSLDGHPGGIIHIYQPGAFNMTQRQRQRFWWSLWLARRWGIRIVSTDSGGWWQSVRILRYQPQRAFEQAVFAHSDVVLAYTRQPKQLYPDKKLRKRVRCLPHPGFRGHYPAPLPCEQARQQLGLPIDAARVYLCFADQHSESELLQLVQGFLEIEEKKKAAQQLLLVGTPKDKAQPAKLLREAALHNNIHLSLSDVSEDDLPLYMGAASAVVLPHAPLQNAGCLSTAMLALSYERFTIVPDLPRFRGMLPPHLSMYYDPTSRASLVRAMAKIQQHPFHLNERDSKTLNVTTWQQHAQRLLEIYKQLRQ